MGEEEHIAPETRVVKDLTVPAGEGVIHLQGYAYNVWSETSLLACRLAFFRLWFTFLFFSASSRYLPEKQILAIA